MKHRIHVTFDNLTAEQYRIVAGLVFYLAEMLRLSNPEVYYNYWEEDDDC